MRLVVVMLFVLVSAAPLVACSCSDPVPPCAVYFQTPLIFIGRTTEPPPRPVWPFPLDEERISTFEVEEFFRGGEGRVDAVEIHSGPGMCGSFFRAGEPYLVYAYPDKQGRYWSNICSRTTEVSNAQEDLEFLRNDPAARREPWLFGRVTRTEAGASDREVGVAQPGARITLTGTPGVEYQVQADESGRFNDRGIPPGRYHATAEWEEYQTGFRRLMSIPESGCVEYNPVLRWNGTVRVRLESEHPSAVYSGVIRLQDRISGQLINVQSRTPSQSRTQRTIEFQTVPPGQYVVVFNPSGEPSRAVPYGRLYAPGTAKLGEAEVIEVSAERRTHQVPLTLPPVPAPK